MKDIGKIKTELRDWKLYVNEMSGKVDKLKNSMICLIDNSTDADQQKIQDALVGVTQYCGRCSALDTHNAHIIMIITRAIHLNVRVGQPLIKQILTYF